MTQCVATECVWLQAWPADGSPRFRLGRHGDELVAEWVGLGVLRASRAGTHSNFAPAPGADAVQLAKLSTGAICALMQHLVGGIALHGSAIALPGGALIMLGDAGMGKSTTAAALCRRVGAELLADDVVTLRICGEKIMVVPSENTHWLDQASRRALGLLEEHDRKIPVAVSSPARSPVPLMAIAKLDFDEERRQPCLRPLRGSEAFLLLSRALFRFVIDEPEVDLRDFASLADLARHVGIWEVSRARRLSELDACTRMVAKLTSAPVGSIDRDSA